NAPTNALLGRQAPRWAEEAEGTYCRCAPIAEADEPSPEEDPMDGNPSAEPVKIPNESDGLPQSETKSSTTTEEPVNAAGKPNAPSSSSTTSTAEGENTEMKSVTSILGSEAEDSLKDIESSARTVMQ